MKFGPNNPPAGRPVGARNKLQRKFLEALGADFEEHGAGAIRIFRTEDPGGYSKMCAGLVPREFVVENTTSELDDEQIDTIIEKIRDHLMTQEYQSETDSESDAIH